MSYQVLARKWRPATFEQVVGQEHVLKALSHALQTQRLHHAYLFTGTRGVGKTSIARLLAKGLNCETGVTATPCGQCQNCQEITQGRFVDLLEIDAASRTKVDDTREILDNVQYQPVRGRFKVYLIDEVHMLSRHSFNALLKTLEEPPEHVKFLLATTDPQKLPVTVLSRCLQFNLKSVPPKRIADHLARVLDAEGIPYDPPALDLLAQGADGSVRDGMSLTDQAIAHGAGALRLAQVQAMLGTLDSGYAVKLLQALCLGEPARLLAVLDEVEPFSPDHDDLLRQMAAMLHQVALAQFDLLPAELAPGGAEPSQLMQWATQLDREQIQLWYQILIQGRKDLSVAPDPRSGLEMTLLRALAFAPATPLPPLQARQPSMPKVSEPTEFEAHAAGSALSESREPEPRAPESTASAPAPAECSSPEPKPSETIPVSGEMKAETGAHTGVAAEAQPVSPPEEVVTLDREQLEIQAQAEALSQAPGDSQRARPTMPSAPFGQGAMSPPPMPDEAAMEAEQALLMAEAEQMGRPEVPGPAEPPRSGGSGSLATEDLISQVLADQSRLAERFAAQSVAANSAPAAEPTSREAPATRKASSEASPQPDRVAAGQREATAPPKPEATLPGVAGEGASVMSEADRPPWKLDSDDGEGSDPAPLLRQVEAVPVEPAPPSDQSAAESPAVQPPLPAEPESESQVLRSAGVELPEPGSTAESDMLWYRAMAKLGIGARPRQLAVNSVLSREGDSVLLSLRSAQRHLNNDSVVAPLKAALEQLWQSEIRLEIEIADKPGRETPLEIRRRRHREKQADARAALLADPAIQWMQAELGAQLIEESVGYGTPS